jgi:hypothetical protein
MPPERRWQVEDIFSVTLEHEPAARAAFLKDASRAEMRRSAFRSKRCSSRTARL